MITAPLPPRGTASASWSPSGPPGLSPGGSASRKLGNFQIPFLGRITPPLTGLVDGEDIGSRLVARSATRHSAYRSQFVAVDTVGTRCMASDCASTNGPDVAASKFRISKFATASRGRSRTFAWSGLTTRVENGSDRNFPENTFEHWFHNVELIIEGLNFALRCRTSGGGRLE